MEEDCSSVAEGVSVPTGGLDSKRRSLTTERTKRTEGKMGILTTKGTESTKWERLIEDASPYRVRDSE